MLIQIIHETDRPADGGSSVCQLHVARKARKDYGLDTAFTLQDGHPLSEFRVARLLTDRMNAKRDLLLHPENMIGASELNAMNLIDEIMHAAIDMYRDETNHELFDRMEDFLASQIGSDEIDEMLEAYAASIPPSDDVYNGICKPRQYIEDQTNEISNRHILLEDLLVSWIDNKNPAAERMKELFDDSPLLDATAYPEIFRLLPDFFRKEKLHPQTKKPLLQMLMDPIQQHPDSLLDQLEYIRSEWGDWIEDFMERILRSKDFISEEQRVRFDPEIFGPGPVEAPTFDGSEFEQEQFSKDLDWMSNVVLVAKNAAVWLEQLSRHYQRSITTLSDIPDEALAELAARGFNALWLIGVWQRSPASERIKQIMGNQEAAASAYSLISYRIDDSLGGRTAFHALRDKAEAHGIRLACDMVPNHTGLDSEWVCEHPDWFVQSHTPPFPSYKFSGDNLSGDPRIQVYIEDGYWNHTDAAVVYRRVDTNTGEVRYIYHGNDGTHLPWNDTAQLNYLLPQVREAVISEIIKLAKLFPIIRFDAAMTLAKKHVQRLWFPEPGSGGDIASRAEYGMTKEDFNKAFPVEFWREVVDRVQQEAPGTLLLAEAFWMMEGYFVRTLGMHRVYNSAFMNMIKNEDNAKYRETIRNVIAFDPQILKRYVNFMSNPDEETAITQFGSDDKYFGCCILMSTMPGTPMFGHGQVEGFREKYGMEYRRAYHDESPNQYLVERHVREIAPLLKKRQLFSGVKQFRLYDLTNEHGHVNEDVFAYSNRVGNETCLIVYNNRFAEAHGRVHKAAAFMPEDDGLKQTTLAENLGFTTNSDSYLIFRDIITEKDYIISITEIKKRGLPIALAAFKYHVFLEFREVISTAEKPYAELAAHLSGKGTPDIEDALNQWIHRIVIDALNYALEPTGLQKLLSEPDTKAVRTSLALRLTALADSVTKNEALLQLPQSVIEEIACRYANAITLQDSAYSSEKDIYGSAPLLILPFMKIMREIYKQHDDLTLRNRFVKERFLTDTLNNSLHTLGLQEETLHRNLQLIHILTVIDKDLNYAIDSSPALYFEYLFSDIDVQHFTGVNKFEQSVYFNKERFEKLICRLTLLATAECQSNPAKQNKEQAKRIKELNKLKTHAINAAEKAGYQLGSFLKVI